MPGFKLTWANRMVQVFGSPTRRTTGADALPWEFLRMASPCSCRCRRERPRACARQADTEGGEVLRRGRAHDARRPFLPVPIPWSSTFETGVPGRVTFESLPPRKPTSGHGDGRPGFRIVPPGGNRAEPGFSAHTTCVLHEP